MTPLVAIELAGPGTAASYEREMLGACTASLRRGECVLKPATGTPERRPDATAEVTAENDLRFEIRVTRFTGDAAATATLARTLEFRPIDAPEERWRSVGIAIASTASALGGFGDEEKPAPGPERASSARADSGTERPLRMAGGMITGTGVESRRVRLGGWLEGSAHFGAPYALVFGRYASAPAGHFESDGGPVDVTATFTTMGLGGGIAPFELGGVGLRLQVAGLAERFNAIVHDSSRDFVSSDDRWLPGALAALEAAWPENGPVGALVGGELQGVTGETALKLDGETIGSNPTLRWSFFFGLELRP